MEGGLVKEFGGNLMTEPSLLNTLSVLLPGDRVFVFARSYLRIQTPQISALGCFEAYICVA